MFCAKLRIKIKQLLRQFNSLLESKVDIALKVTTAIKNILESPVASIITAIIPGTTDDVIKAKLIYGLSIAIEGLDIVQDCKSKETLEEKLQCFVAELQKRNPDFQQAILLKVASILARTLDDEALAQNLYDLFVQAKYSSEK